MCRDQTGKSTTHTPTTKNLPFLKKLYQFDKIENSTITLISLITNTFHLLMSHLHFFFDTEPSPYNPAHFPILKAEENFKATIKYKKK